MKKLFKIITLMSLIFIFMSCMKNNVDSNIPFNWVVNVKDVNSEGNEVLIKANYTNFGSGIGGDNIIFYLPA